MIGRPPTGHGIRIHFGFAAAGQKGRCGRLAGLVEESDSEPLMHHCILIKGGPVAPQYPAHHASLKRIINRRIRASDHAHTRPDQRPPYAGECLGCQRRKAHPRRNSHQSTSPTNRWTIGCWKRHPLERRELATQDFARSSTQLPMAVATPPSLRRSC